mmetsp:Transcript_53657/g.157924  ORF Transcript_53657/g.157924 Transcript_53657/m.157924 type:complete len:251 (+) Transcript_53657:111-863(+)
MKVVARASMCTRCCAAAVWSAAAAVHLKLKYSNTSTAAFSHRRLHRVLELQEGDVRSLRIGGVHLGHHVGADVLAEVELGDGVVHVHGLGLTRGRDHVANRRVDGRVVGQRGHERAVHAANGLVVSLAAGLERRAVHRGSHHDHLVDGLHDGRGVLSRDLGEDIRGPVDLLQEGVGRLGQLGRRVIDLVGVSSLRAQHGQHASGRGHGGRAASRRRHERVAQAREDHQGHDERRASLPVRHGLEGSERER